MGVLPKSLWQKFLQPDEKNRITLALNCFLIKSEGKNILVDTGIGNKLPEKSQKIYQASDFRLPHSLESIGIHPQEIDFVVLSHLHFDHAGGVVTLVNGEPELTFPNAIHVIQEKEWNTAKNPDNLNKPAYNFKDDLELLEKSGNFKLVNGDYKITNEVSVSFTGGHSEGNQIVKVHSDNEFAVFAGDIIAMKAHQHPAVTTAYDVSRRDTFAAKNLILNELNQTHGTLLLVHEPDDFFQKY
jgi:glyoxylase-like metal-dependent hydrolase (beta-lactamase superfamily II)